MLEAREIVPASAEQAHSSLSVLRSLPRTVIKVEFAAEQLRPAEEEFVQLCSWICTSGISQSQFRSQWSLF
jgi:hypothetical protein